MTADGRGLLLTVDFEYEVHRDDLYTAWEETWQTVQELAYASAVRSYDVLAAAQLTDRLSRSDLPAQIKSDLDLLRSVQTRLAARHVEALLWAVTSRSRAPGLSSASSDQLVSQPMASSTSRSAWRSQAS